MTTTLTADAADPRKTNPDRTAAWWRPCSSGLPSALPVACLGRAVDDVQAFLEWVAILGIFGTLAFLFWLNRRLVAGELRRLEEDRRLARLNHPGPESPDQNA